MKSRILAVTLMSAVFTVGVMIEFPPPTLAQTFGVLYEFTGGADGGNPYASTLVQDLVGNLYGTTEYGGNLTCTGGLSPGCGTVFKLDSGSETVLHSFAGSPDGAFPLPGLMQDRAGNLYGTTFEGGTGSSSNGTIFKVTATGNDVVLYSFAGSPDGGSPFSVLIRDSIGNIYGTTRSGGAFGFGSVFKLNKSGKESVLYSFTGGPDGATPFAGLILDPAGNLYGTTYAGGASSGHGVVFKLDTSGTETVLHTFTASTDGANPYAGLTRDSQGNLYGTTYFGGKSGFGTIFKIDTTGRETVLHSFAGPEGANPYFGSLVIDENGNLFGTASTGGASNLGTVFHFNSVLRKLKVLHTFSGTDGANPLGGLLDGADGKLYGTTYQGGTFGAGVTFALGP
jgi:uncharacterized repeat protein (TIGR03803 family)